MTFDEPQDLNAAAAQGMAQTGGQAPMQAPILPPQLPQMPQPQPQGGGQQALAALVLGLMAGAGPRSGMAAGVGSGFQQQQAQMQAVEQQRRKQLEAQNAQRNQMLMQALETMKRRRDQIPNKGQYDTELEGWATQLRSAGFRVDSNWLRQTVPFVAPDVTKQAGDAVQAYLKNPANKQVLEQHPEQLANVFVKFDRDGDGIPENVPLLQLAEIGKVPFSIDQGGQVIGYPKDADPEDRATMDADFQDALAQAKAEGKDTADPAVRLVIRRMVMSSWESRKRLSGGTTGRGTPYQDARAQAVAEYIAEHGPLPRGEFANEGGVRTVSEQGGSRARTMKSANEAIAARTAELMDRSKPKTEKAEKFQTKTGVVPGYEKHGPIHYQLDPTSGDVVVGGKNLGPVIVRDPSPADDPLTTKNRFDMSEKLSEVWDKANKAPREMERQTRLMDSALRRVTADPIGASEAIITTFKKVLDPGSVVMVSEYARTPEGLSITDRLQGLYDRAVKGGAGVPANVLREMVATAHALVKGMDGYNAGLKSRIDAQIKVNKLDPSTIFGVAQPARPEPQEAPVRSRPGGLTPGLQQLENR